MHSNAFLAGFEWKKRNSKKRTVEVCMCVCRGLGFFAAARITSDLSI